MDRLAATGETLAAYASYLDARRATILETWRDIVSADETLDSASEWTLKQFNDHFPDVLKALSRGLLAWPAQPASLEHDEQGYAIAHARTRWLQGYSLRGVIREWGHFNAVVVDQIAACAASNLRDDGTGFRLASAIWARILNEQQAISALEYRELEKAEAGTRSAELHRMLEVVRGESLNRGRVLESLASGMRNDLQLVMAAQTLGRDETGWHQAYELRQLSQDGFRGLERALTDMVTLANLEAGQEARQLSTFDAGHGFELLAEGVRHVAEQRGITLQTGGPESFTVQGDAERVRRLAKHLLFCALRAPTVDCVALNWGPDTRSATRWDVIVEHTFRADSTGSARIGDAIATATTPKHDVAGVERSGYESALESGLIPVGSGDGVDLLIVKHLCELLDASLEVEAEQGLIRYRTSLPLEYPHVDGAGMVRRD